jgi:hydrogenase maturation protease
LTTLILGLGNPILTDDAVGLHVAREVRRLLGEQGTDVDHAEASATSLDLISLIEGYDRVVMVDALIVTKPTPGRLHRLTLADLPSQPTSTSLHGLGPRVALEFGRSVGAAVPSDVVIYGIEVLEPYAFGSDLTPAVAAAVPGLALTIVQREFGAQTDVRGDMV